MPDLRTRVEHVLRTEAAPALGLDGSEIEVLDVEDGIARVRLGAACASCGVSVFAVVQGLEQELRQRVPEVEVIEAVA